MFKNVKKNDFTSACFDLRKLDYGCFFELFLVYFTNFKST